MLRAFAKRAPAAVGVAVAFALVATVFRDVDRARVATLVARSGVSLLLALAPQAVSFLSESFGWQQLVVSLGYRLDLFAMLRVRVATEALSQSLPVGVVWCESMKPVLLQRHAGLPLVAGVAAAAGRKYVRLWSQAAYISLAFAVGYATLRRASMGLIGRGGLQWLVLVTALVLSLASASMALGLSSSALGRCVSALLARLPIAGARRGARREGFAQAGAQLARVGRLGLRSLAVPVVACLVAWCAESIETLIALRLLGVRVGLDDALAIETTVSLARQLLFMVPAGIGVQDAGYVGFLAALGVPAALEVGAAFALVKRGRELVYTALGLGLLVAPPPRFRAASASQTP